VVDAFDNIAGRRAVSEATAELGVACLHIALAGSGEYGCGLWDGHYALPTVSAGADRCDYPLTRPLALMVAASAAEVVVRYLLDGSRRSFELTLGDLRLAAR
jgi:molybdopterin-synthase adenylyltransferase